MKLKNLNERIFLWNNDKSFYCFNRDSLQILELDKEAIDLLKKSIFTNDYTNLPKELIDFINSKQNQIEPYFNPSFFGFRLALTEKCNLKCKHCFVTKDQKASCDMTPKTLDKILNYILKYAQTRSVKIHFFGGEPLIKFDLIKKTVEFLEKEFKKNNIKKPNYSISTNGILVNDKIAKFFKKYNFFVGVSLDGIKEDNDKLRVHYDGSGTYDEIRETLSRLAKHKINFYLLITPYLENKDKFIPFIEKIIKDFSIIKTITINTPVNTDKSWKLNGKLFSDIVYKAILIGNKNNIVVESSASSILYSLAHNLPRKSPCALYNYEVMASISTKGEISYCAQDWKKELKIVDNKLKINPFKIKSRYNNQCQICPARYLCGGPCYICIKEGSKKLDKNRCNFFNEMLKTILLNIDKIEKWNTRPIEPYFSL